MKQKSYFGTNKELRIKEFVQLDFQQKQTNMRVMNK